ARRRPARFHTAANPSAEAAWAVDAALRARSDRHEREGREAQQTNARAGARLGAQRRTAGRSIPLSRLWVRGIARELESVVPDRNSRPGAAWRGVRIHDGQPIDNSVLTVCIKSGEGMPVRDEGRQEKPGSPC